MSYAPERLKELRAYLKEKTGDDQPSNFGIKARVSSRRNSGYHLGKSDIFGPGGLGDRDYSIQRPRDLAGLTDAASAIDIKRPRAEMIRIRKHLITEAKAGRAPDLVQIIGPDTDGRAYEWRKPDWVRIGPRPRGDSHEYHDHISFHRDSELRDKIGMFEGLYGPRAVVDPATVRMWQERLVVHGFPVVVDGILGPATDAAIRAFQQASGLQPDGIVGLLTLAALVATPEPEPEPVPEPEPQPTPEELLKQQVELLQGKIETAKTVLEA